MLAGPGRGFAAMLGRARIGIGNFMADTWRAVPSKARCDWGRLIPGNDRLIGDVDEPDGTGSVQFIFVVHLEQDRAGARSGGPQRKARGALRDWIWLSL